MDRKSIKKSKEELKLEALHEISARFKVADTVQTLQHMMKEVTKNEINVFTVNAACNCVQNLNNTIKTAIHAAKFLADYKVSDDDDY